jgi:acetyl esterase
MTPSQRRSTSTLFLSPERLRATVAAAFPGREPEALRDPQLSPLYADLRGLPPALFSIGTEDAVLDDSLFMAMRWRAAGNLAELAVYPEGPHLFLQLPTQMAVEGQRRIAAFLGRCITS